MPAPFLKKRLWNRFFPVNTFPYRTPPVAASVHYEIIITHHEKLEKCWQAFVIFNVTGTQATNKVINFLTPFMQV